MAILVRGHLLVGFKLAPVSTPSSSSICLSRVFSNTCPACGKAGIFQGMLKLRASCAHCHQDFSAADIGDGPAFFAITLVGFIVTFAAAWVEYHYSPPYWLHALCWLPLTFVLSMLILRVCKSYLLHAAFMLGRLHKEHHS